MPLPNPERIEKARRDVEKAQLKFKQKKARYDALAARVSSERRKLEARRKIILGGLVLKACKSGDWPRDRIDDLLSRIPSDRDVDRKVFVGWSLDGDDSD